MTETQLRQKYEDELPKLKGFAEFVEEFINDLIVDSPEEDFTRNEDIVKVTSARVKDIKSFVLKGLFRGKEYSNPMEQIEDKVGIRIVAYLEKSIDYICNLVESQNQFSWKKTRVPDKESFESPNCFDYKSSHYVLATKADFNYKEIQINEGTKFELQLRTFEQDFYAYLTHDTTYKSNGHYISGTTKRNVAKTMALLETAQEIAMHTIKEMNDSEDQIIKLFNYLQSSYKSIFSDVSQEVDANFYFLNAVKELLSEIVADDLTETVRNERFIRIIRDKREYNSLYQLPIVFLIYYFLSKKKHVFRRIWPYTPDALESFLVDCGISQRD